MCFQGTCHCNPVYQGDACNITTWDVVMVDWQVNVTFVFPYGLTPLSFWTASNLANVSNTIKKDLAHGNAMPNVTTTASAYSDGFSGGSGSRVSSDVSFYAADFADSNLVAAKKTAAATYSYNPAARLGVYFDLPPPPPPPPPPELPPVVNITFAFVYGNTSLSFWNETKLSNFSASLAALLAVPNIGSPNVTSVAGLYLSKVNGSVITSTALYNTTIFNATHVAAALLLSKNPYRINPGASLGAFFVPLDDASTDSGKNGTTEIKSLAKVGGTVLVASYRPFLTNSKLTSRARCLRWNRTASRTSARWVLLGDVPVPPCLSWGYLPIYLGAHVLAPAVLAPAHPSLPPPPPPLLSLFQCWTPPSGFIGRSLVPLFLFWGYCLSSSPPTFSTFSCASFPIVIPVLGASVGAGIIAYQIAPVDAGGGGLTRIEIGRSKFKNSSSPSFVYSPLSSLRYIVVLEVIQHIYKCAPGPAVVVGLSHVCHRKPPLLLPFSASLRCC